MRVPRDENRIRFQEEVARKQIRKMRSRRQKKMSILSGLGMYGIIGWSVAIPTLIGVAVGLWIDRRWPSQISWTVTFILIGVAIGCLNAWYWVTRERDTIDRDRKDG
jgi:ATP synthase protein I